MTQALSDTLTLNDGTTLPAVGFGTYKLNGQSGAHIITQAIANGYRVLDSAFNYENEGAVGEAVRRSGLPRERVRVISKLPGRHHAYDQATATIEESVLRMSIDHIDLYLIHWPNPKRGLFVDAWRALIEARERGLVRTLGVCNFLPEHIETLIKETGVAPAVNQIELHPYFPQPGAVAFHQRMGIITQAWSPLGRANTVLTEPLLVDIARRVQRTVGQVILRWHLQWGSMPLPKSSTPARQKENLALFDFELSHADMQAIATLAKPEGRLKDQDPAEYEEF